jgi:hypothetical protein
VFEKTRVLLRDAVAELGADIVGSAIWKKYHRWPVYSKFFDNMGPIPHHMHQSGPQAKLVGREGKPEGYYFPAQLNNVGNNFPHTYFGLEPGVTRKDVRRCLENWEKGDNGILDLSKAYRLNPGTGWLVPPCILHAPGSLLTYEPQWGSDVFGMYQSMVEGRYVPWDLLVKDMPKSRHRDLDFITDQLDWKGNTDPRFRDHHYLEPIPVADTSCEGWVDKWIVYGTVDGKQLFSARELTLQPGARCTIKDGGASGLITVQGSGRIGGLRLDAPVMIRFGAMTEDEVFVSHEAAVQGVAIQNTGAEPLVTLRYFGPDTWASVPAVGDQRKNR